MLDTVVIAVPVQERRRAHDFYAAALGLEAFGDLADDGLPEPLQLRLSEGAVLMCIPTGGFGWAIGDDHEPAGPNVAEMLLSFTAPDAAGVDAAVERAAAAGATVVTAPSQQPWGYEGTFADPDGHLWSVMADPGS